MKTTAAYAKAAAPEPIKCSEGPKFIQEALEIQSKQLDVLLLELSKLEDRLANVLEPFPGERSDDALKEASFGFLNLITRHNRSLDAALNQIQQIHARLQL